MGQLERKRVISADARRTVVVKPSSNLAVHLATDMDELMDVSMYCERAINLWTEAGVESQAHLLREIDQRDRVQTWSRLAPIHEGSILEAKRSILAAEDSKRVV